MSRCIGNFLIRVVIDVGDQAKLERAYGEKA